MSSRGKQTHAGEISHPAEISHPLAISERCAAIHDLDIARWLMGSRGSNEPVRIYATGACNVDKSILELKDSNPSEAIDTANILIEFASGSTATIQVGRKGGGASKGERERRRRADMTRVELLLRHCTD